jgi:hypothetical protein
MLTSKISLFYHASIVISEKSFQMLGFQETISYLCVLISLQQFHKVRDIDVKINEAEGPGKHFQVEIGRHIYAFRFRTGR